jgi:hypothetical protein
MRTVGKLESEAGMGVALAKYSEIGGVWIPSLEMIAGSGWRKIWGGFRRLGGKSRVNQLGWLGKAFGDLRMLHGPWAGLQESCLLLSRRRMALIGCVGLDSGEYYR